MRNNWKRILKGKTNNDIPITTLSCFSPCFMTCLKWDLWNWVKLKREKILLTSACIRYVSIAWQGKFFRSKSNTRCSKSEVVYKAVCEFLMSYRRCSNKHFYIKTNKCLKMGLIFGSFGWKRSNEAGRHGVDYIQCLFTEYIVTLLFGYLFWLLTSLFTLSTCPWPDICKPFMKR